MAIAKEITKFHYKELKGFSGLLFGAVVFLPLFFASIFYYLGICFKNFLYKIGVLKEISVKAKVICIGNLTTGGVGKTPVTIEFCKALSKKCRVSSLSRGYRGKLKGANVIRDFQGILINNPELTGDEVQLIANSAGGEENFAVVTSSNRLLGANKVIEELGADVIVMDDGFSNRKVKKDLSLLLFDVKRFIGNGIVLPFGPLREPVAEIKRVDGVILIDKEGSNPDKKEALADFIESKLKKQVFFADFKPDYFYDIKTGAKVDKAEITYAFAFSGIGQPEGFYNYLSNELDGFNLSAVMSFDDHHRYTKEDMQNICVAARKRGAKYLVTTEKDAAKVLGLTEDVSPPVLALKLRVDIDVWHILDELGFKYETATEAQK